MAKGKERDLKREAYWRRMLARRQRGGLTVRQFCREHQLPETTYHFRRREIARRDGENSAIPAKQAGAAVKSARRQSAAAQRKPVVRRKQSTRNSPPSLLPVTIAPAIVSHIGAARPIEVALPGGAIVRIGRGCDQATLCMVFGALEADGCSR